MAKGPRRFRCTLMIPHEAVPLHPWGLPSWGAVRAGKMGPPPGSWSPWRWVASEAVSASGSLGACARATGLKRRWRGCHRVRLERHPARLSGCSALSPTPLSPVFLPPHPRGWQSVTLFRNDIFSCEVTLGLEGREGSLIQHYCFFPEEGNTL